MPVCGYARVSTDAQTLDAQLAQLKAAGAEKVFREKVSGARADRPQLARLLRSLAPGDRVLVTRLDRLARSTRDLLNTLAAIADHKAGFRSLNDAWADTTTPHGRLATKSITLLQSKEELSAALGLAGDIATADLRPTLSFLSCAL